MIIDLHTHIGRSRDGAHQNIHEILDLMKQYGIGQSLVFPIDEEKPGPSYQRLNRLIARVVKRYPNIMGCARLNPNQLGACFDEIDFAVRSGFRAVKLHPRSDQFCATQSSSLFDEINKHKLIVILHTDHESNCHPMDWFRFFKKYPKIPFVLTHAGKDLYKQAIHAAQKFRNVFLDTSTISYYRTSQILKEAGAQKIVFASDIPYSHIGIELRKFELLLPISKRRIVYLENAKRILDL